MFNLLIQFIATDEISLVKRYHFIVITATMNEVGENCSLCNKPNDQMLMLSCVHDPCINCAASAYAQQIHIKGQTRQLYICQICGQQTMLDNSTINELTALASTVIKMPTKKEATGTRNPQPSPAPRRKETQHPSSLPTTSASKKIVYYCKEHSEEEISYYCFTCWANICPECAIHGSHKDHEVKLIKKAIAHVKGEYLQITTKVAEAQTGMGKLKQGFLRMIKETNDRHARQKNSVTREFDILRATIAAKEKELIRELEDINKQNLAALTNFLQTINANYEEANKVKRNIETITKKDQVLILEDYRKIGELEQSVLALNKTTDSIAGHASYLNVEFLQQECKGLVEGVGRVKVNLKKDEVGSTLILGGQRSGTTMN